MPSLGAVLKQQSCENCKNKQDLWGGGRRRKNQNLWGWGSRKNQNMWVWVPNISQMVPDNIASWCLVFGVIWKVCTVCVRAMYISIHSVTHAEISKRHIFLNRTDLSPTLSDTIRDRYRLSALFHSDIHNFTDTYDCYTSVIVMCMRVFHTLRSQNVFRPPPPPPHTHTV